MVEWGHLMRFPTTFVYGEQSGMTDFRRGVQSGMTKNGMGTSY